MVNLVELDKDDSIKVLSTIVKYDRPDTIFMPINIEAQILVKKNELVKIGTPLFRTKSDVITSPISGKVIGISNVFTSENETRAIEIKNNFEESKIIKPIKKIDFKNIEIDKLNKILDLSFKIKIDKDILILKAIDDEPYILTEASYLFYYYEEFLELLDKFFKIYNLKKIIIVIKASNGEQISKLMEWLGMYPNIVLEIVPDLYLIGEDSFLKSYLEVSDAVIIKASVFYDIFNLIKRNRQITDKIITISGDGIENPIIIKVKLGTKLKDIIDNYIKLKNQDVIYYSNGLMRGRKIALDNFIITRETKGILIMSKTDNKREEECIKCGACAKSCPVNLKPYLFSDPKYLKIAKDKCLNCGLCTYICPSYINFNNYLGGDYE